MPPMLYLSRAFVEFGPFTSTEMQAFHARGILKDSDYVRPESSDSWVHVSEWAAALPVVEAPPPSSPPAKKAAAKKATAPVPAKKAPAKKTAKKKAS